MSVKSDDKIQQECGWEKDRNYEAFHLAELVGMPLSEAGAIVELCGGSRQRSDSAKDTRNTQE